MFAAETIRAMMEHAVAEYPRESCGLVVDGAYRPMPNVADDPRDDFRMEDAALLTPGVLAVVHSHPGGPDRPSHEDMSQQMASDLPWGIVVVRLDDGRSRPEASPPFWFGDQVPRPPLIGREFRHGVADCYALCRDWWLAETGELLPDFPRPDRWWERGGDLIMEHLSAAGFAPVPLREVRRGDGLLFASTRRGPADHLAVCLGDGTMLHHVFGRLSAREPVGRWAGRLRLAVRRSGT